MGVLNCKAYSREAAKFVALKWESMLKRITRRLLGYFAFILYFCHFSDEPKKEVFKTRLAIGSPVNKFKTPLSE